MAGLRALLSLVMLAGFYGVAFVQLVATVALTYWLSLMLPGPMGLILTLPLYVVGIGSVAGALWVALRSRFEPMGGVVVGRELAGPLWTMVDELAEQAGTRKPEEIRIVTGVEASVSERVRALGLLPGKRYLFLGLPLLLALSQPQIRAVVAHELGHYSHAHARMAPVAYRGRRAIAGTVGRIHQINPAGWAFRAYYHLYVLVDRSMSRLQELQADAHAVRAAGKAAAIGSLVEVRAVAAAFSYFVESQIMPRADHGYLPDNLYEGFTTFLKEREADLARLRAKALEDKGGAVWDTHPPVKERVFLMERLEGDAPKQPDEGPGGELVADAGELGRVLTPHVVPHLNCEALPWDEFVAAAASAQVRAEVRRVLNQRVLNQRRGDALDALKDAEEKEIVVVLANAALQSGVGRWRASWTGPAGLVGDDGEPLPLNELARLARKPGGLDRLRRRLEHLGIKVGAGEGMEEDRQTGGGVKWARLLGGIGNVKTEARPFSAEADLLILSTGLVLMPTTRGSEEGNIRMRAVMSRMPLEDIAAKYRYVPFEAIGFATVTRKIPLRARLTLYDGETVVLRESWTGDRLMDDSADVLLALLSRYPQKS